MEFFRIFEAAGSQLIFEFKSTVPMGCKTNFGGTVMFCLFWRFKRTTHSLMLYLWNKAFRNTSLSISQCIIIEAKSVKTVICWFYRTILLYILFIVNRIKLTWHSRILFAFNKFFNLFLFSFSFCFFLAIFNVFLFEKKVNFH